MVKKENVDGSITAVPPKSIWLRPVDFDGRKVFSALARFTVHGIVGKWEDAAIDLGDLLSSAGISSKPEELVWVLTSRASLSAMATLVRQSAPYLEVGTEAKEEELSASVAENLLATPVTVGPELFSRPGDSNFLEPLATALTEWLVRHGMNEPSAGSVSARLSSPWQNWFSPEVGPEMGPAGTSPARQCDDSSRTDNEHHGGPESI